MADIGQLIDQLRRDGAFQRIATNPAAQFGTPARELIGARYLPVRVVNENSYTDDTVKYRTIVANAGTRYSPVVLKGGQYTGRAKVELFEMDIGAELSSRDYDALLAYLNANRTIEAVTALTDFVNITTNMALEELREVYRWQAIEKAFVMRRGANNYREDIAYSNPAGHRAVVASPWSDDANDPFDDIANRQQLAADKGFTIGTIVTSRNVVGIMAMNENVRTRVGTVKVSVANGAMVTSPSARASLSLINAALQDEGLPPITIYDEIYRDQLGTHRFISADVMIFLARTGREVPVDLGDEAATIELLGDTLGYYGVGRAAGQSAPGRVIQARYYDDKPPRVGTQGWETSAPVILEPEAVETLTGIA
jgi:hypothetical protein